MINNVVLVGNLGGDPEVFFTPEGSSIAKFSLAFKSSKQKTSWMRCVCFGKLAEIAEKHLHQGARVGIVGSLDEQKWESEGVKRSSFQINCNSIEFIKTDGRGFEDNGFKDQF